MDAYIHNIEMTAPLRSQLQFAGSKHMVARRDVTSRSILYISSYLASPRVRATHPRKSNMSGPRQLINHQQQPQIQDRKLYNPESHTHTPPPLLNMKVYTSRHCTRHEFAPAVARSASYGQG